MATQITTFIYLFI